MDWNNFLNDGTALVTSLGLNGITLGMVAFKTFVLDKLGNKNIKKLMSFTAVADKNFKDNSALFLEMKNKLISEFKEQVDTIKLEFKQEIESIKAEVVKPFIAQVTTLSKDNEALSNIAVVALSTSNIPLSQKKDMFVVLNKVSNISLQAKTILETSIRNQESQLVIEQSSNNLLEQKISNS